MNWVEKIGKLTDEHHCVFYNTSRKELITDAVKHKEAVISESGALATWTPVESTGRSPKDTVIVQRASNLESIDWNSPNNIPVSEETFNMAMEEGLSMLENKSALYIADKVIGADVSYALPVKILTDKALTVLFADNMFRPVPEEIDQSVFSDLPFTLIVIPYDKLDSSKYAGRLRQLDSGHTTNMIIAIDLERRLGLIIGSAYCGSVKKLMFTVMNALLPDKGVLPLHCSANEGPDGRAALLLGLSGTGKTTLSADPSRALLGDDEHGWSEEGIANFENGCYAKCIHLDPAKEPEIYKAIMHKDAYTNHGAIVENVMIYPDGTLDFSDSRLTENSRASYPLAYLSGIKQNSKCGHPATIFFLTADANGVIPPIACLAPEQAMLWFLMGYTSKLAGTETGIIKPQSTFSRFFGQPFMPLNPNRYAEMLGQKLEQYNARVYLVNTGWCGAPYGMTARMDIDLTRSMINAALSGDLDNAEYEQDAYFKVWIPKSCPGVPENILNPVNLWADINAYKSRASALAGEFAAHFKKAYGDKQIAEKIKAECPGL